MFQDFSLRTDMRSTGTCKSITHKIITVGLAVTLVLTFACVRPAPAEASSQTGTILDGLTLSEDGNSATVQDGYWMMHDQNLLLKDSDNTTLIESPLKGRTVAGDIRALGAVISPDAKTVTLRDLGSDTSPAEPQSTSKNDTLEENKKGRVVKVDELIRRYQQYIITSFRYDKTRFILGGLAGVLAANVIVWMLFALIEGPIFIFVMPLWLPVFAVWIVTEFLAGFIGFYAGSTLIGLTSEHPEVRRDAELTLEEYDNVKEEFIQGIIEAFS